MMAEFNLITNLANETQDCRLYVRKACALMTWDMHTCTVYVIQYYSHIIIQYNEVDKMEACLLQNTNHISVMHK